MGRAYEGDPTRLPAESFGLTPVVPPKRNRTAPWDYDREAYKGRNMVERVFNRMKHHRKAATRYDRLDETFLANLQLIPIAVYLKKHSQKPNQCKHPSKTPPCATTKGGVLVTRGVGAALTCLCTATPR